MKTFISVKEWLEIPKDTRNKIILELRVGKSSHVSVIDGKIVCDGCTQDDLIRGITIGKMIEYIGDDWEKKPNDEIFDYLLSEIITSLSKEESKTQPKDNVESVKVEDTELNTEKPIQRSSAGRGIGSKRK